MSLTSVPVTEDEKRELFVRSGGHPFVTLTVVDEATGQVEVTAGGLSPEQIVAGLREAADEIVMALIEENTRAIVDDPEKGLPALDLTQALERARQL